MSKTTQILIGKLRDIGEELHTGEISAEDFSIVAYELAEMVVALGDRQVLGELQELLWRQDG